ncbi:MAG: cadmium-translocating P-type ATPase [Clostridia bacterium]|nr:cadmium-translocating P-type ATPase [Clostridia bacterium]
MKKDYILKGLDCPNCSAKIEDEVKKLDYVVFASVNLMQQSLAVEFEEKNASDIDRDVEKIVHSHEPDVEVSLKNAHNHECDKDEFIDECRDCQGHCHDDGDDDFKSDLIKIIIGAVVYAAALILNAVLDLPFAVYITMLLAAYVILGGEVVLHAVKNIFRGRIFDENFLMTVSTVGAFAIGEYPEAVAVMLFYTVGELFQELAVRRSRKSITELMDIRPDRATVLRNGEQMTVYPDEVEPGETIIIRPGEKIPLDGIITDGESTLDTKAITGESAPRNVFCGDEVLSGSINVNGVITVKTTKSFGESTVSKIIDLVQNASSNKAPTENFITAFAKYYTPAVVAAAVLLAVIPPLFFNGLWSDWLYRAFSFLVISCPCALVISIPLAFFGGIGAASKHGILVKGGNYLEALNKVETVIFDKTGTITKGVFKVSETVPAEGISADELSEAAAYAECFSNHPIAISVIESYGKSVDRGSISEYEEIAGYGIRAVKNGEEILAGNEKLMEKRKIDFSVCDGTGTKVYIAKDGRYLGCIVISDEIKKDSKNAVSDLKKLGVKKTVMLTGDSEIIAKDICEKTGIDEFYASLLPDEKVKIIEKIKKETDNRSKIAFAGDGINDAPSLATADIGIAMGGTGSDAAIEAADFVLMTDEPSKIAEAIKIAGETKKTVIENIVFALGVKAIFLLLSAFGAANMWMAVFADVGVALIAILNSIRILRK